MKPKENANNEINTHHNNLHAAKANANDEFYTRIVDIENELKNYRGQFKDKIIFLNCDDPEESNFWKYFYLNFKFLGLKKLISTHYDYIEPTYKMTCELDSSGELKLTKENLMQNGDFRSPEAIELLKEADIVVTNPPFSLFREYIAQLMEYNKKFLVIGNFNSVTYKEIFPLIKNNEIWTGVSPRSMKFITPEEEIKTVNATWFTNLEHNKRNEEIILWKNYYGNEDEYPKYDNYDAIEVSKVKEIPMDYDGVMGVPITFLGSYNPKQFEILGITSGRDEFESVPTKRYINPVQVNKDGSTTSGSKANTRSTILLKEKPDGIYYTADNADGYMKIMYARILIRKKK